MPSPFPGMDPWLERPTLFPSLHGALIGTLRAALNAALPTGYVATQDSRVYIDPELSRVPDIGVYGGPEAPLASDGGTAVATMTGAGLLLASEAAPVSDPTEEVYLEVWSVEDDRLVTAVEVVSPSNKRAGESGRTSYKQKQNEFRTAGVNLVEIDLLRGGPHTTAVPEARLRAVAGDCEYHVSVLLAGVRARYFVAPIRLAAPLPVVPFPLDSGVTPVSIPLQAVFDRAYDEGGFAKLGKYDRRDPDPPLSPEQQAWADAILREKGLKS